MIYLIIAAIIVLITSIRAISFSIWQFKNKNILGGIMVFLLSVSAVVLTAMQLKI